ncbi:MAG: aldose 1-epimerase [Thermoleophilaceae bacterium]
MAGVDGEYEVTETIREGYDALALSSPRGPLTAVVCPRLGMIGCSLDLDGSELLGQRSGLPRYEATGSTMGIPFLHPWANRLAGLTYEAAGRRVRLDPDSPLLRLDPNGLPIHGLLAASPYWRLTASQSDDRSARVEAALEFGAHPELLEGFPFPHDLGMEFELSGTALTVTTTLTPTADLHVPVSFGYHPYLTLPQLPRSEWEIEIPARRRLRLDERMIPTGETEPADFTSGPLGERGLDDAFCDLVEGEAFVLSGADIRLGVELLEGYAFAQVYAPTNLDVVCFEPMTAPANALLAGGPTLQLVAPGETYTARFRITVDQPYG